MSGHKDLDEDEAMRWTLSCGHEVPMLEHDRPDDPPRRPRMCPVCQKPRNVVVAK